MFHSAALIDGLSVSPETEARIWTAFEAWSPRATRRLREHGVPGVLALYEAVVRSAETRSCLHGPDGTVLTGEDWKWCCGISYEYLAAIQIRDSLQMLLEVTSPEETPALRDAVRQLDARLLAMIDAPAEPHWWDKHLPRTVTR